MLRYSSTIFAAMLLLLVNFFVASSSHRVYDVRKLAEDGLVFTDKDNVPESELTRLLDEDRATRFIGDLVIGERRSDETIFRRNVEVSNPTDGVYSTTINLTVTNGIIHYMSLMNEPGSYAVACYESKSLEKSKSGFNVRVLPNSRSILTMVVAAH